MNAPVSYTPNFLSFADEAFKVLWNELDWIRHDKVPRAEYYVSRYLNDYTYGQGEFARTYKSQFHHTMIEAIWNELYKIGYKFDVCFLNKYEDASDQLGWHADDSPEMDDLRSIAIISLYPPNVGEREIWFRQNPYRDENGKAVPVPVEKVRLGHGSLCAMDPGMQDTHQHRIPKADRQDAGPRISLTFRGLDLGGSKHVG